MKKITILSSLFLAASMFFIGCEKEPIKVEDEDKTPKPQVTVEKINNSVTQKVTGTRCPPCGGWGWTMMDELLAFGAGKSFFISTYSQNFVAEGFITQTSTDMDKQWKITGYPTFVANGKPMLARTSQGINLTEEKRLCREAVDNHRNAPVIANVGVEKSFDGNTMNIKTSTQFFENATGDYKLALYVVENDAKWKQSGHPQGASPIPHHYVMRGAVNNNTWGEIVSSGEVTANKFFDKNFTYDVDASWDKTKISVIAVVWKVNGSNYDFVNANSTK
jgi:hypothetical protein